MVGLAAVLGGFLDPQKMSFETRGKPVVIRPNRPSRRWTFPCHLTAAAGWPAVVIALSAAALGIFLAGRWVDRNVLGGKAKDAWSLVRWHENWEMAEPIASGLNRAWLDLPHTHPVRIGHALGASGGRGQNRLESVQPAWNDGIRLFEVDVWLDKDGQLRCYHGPPEPPPMAQGDCTLAALIPMVAARGGWIVLDIKSDFEATGNKVIDIAEALGHTDKLIFQLYFPAHLALFSRWATRVPLSTPIVTAYASHRSVQHIADQLRRLRISAFTVPIETLPSLSSRPEGVSLLVHPVHDCTAWKAVEKHNPYAVYTVMHLHCD